MGLIPALSGPTVLVLGGTLILPESHGGPLQAQIPPMWWNKTPVTVGKFERYLETGDKIGGRFGVVVFHVNGAVAAVIRGRTSDEALAESVRAINNLRCSGARSVYSSDPRRLVPTVDEWRGRFSGLPNGGGLFLGEDHPAVFVDWFEACGFADQAGGRLPTELEWYWAALGGRRAEAEEAEYATPLETAIWNRTIKAGTAAVVDDKEILASRTNPYGLVDLTGNVWEWQANSWTGSYQTLVEHPFGTWERREGARGLRGGSWLNGVPDFLRAAFRGLYRPVDRSDDVGFRVASAVPQDSR